MTFLIPIAIEALNSPTCLPQDYPRPSSQITRPNRQKPRAGNAWMRSTKTGKIEARSYSPLPSPGEIPRQNLHPDSNNRSSQPSPTPPIGNSANPNAIACAKAASPSSAETSPTEKCRSACSPAQERKLTNGLDRSKFRLHDDTKRPKYFISFSLAITHPRHQWPILEKTPTPHPPILRCVCK
jgi:hypothetical protein